MKESPREMFNAFVNGLGGLGDSVSDELNGFMGLLGATFKDSALDTKTKELICLSIGINIRCVYCIAYHTYKCLEAGATREEILSAAMVAVAMGGGPAMAYTVTTTKECIDEFEKDFK